MTTTEDRLTDALRTESARFSPAPDLAEVVARSGRIRRRRLATTTIAAAAVVAVVSSSVPAGGGTTQDRTGKAARVFAPVPASPLSPRIWASEVSLGSEVFVWGGLRTTLSYKAPAQSGAESVPSPAPGSTGPAAPFTSGLLADGAMFFADTGKWRPLAAAPLTARADAPAVNTPAGVLVVGGGRTGFRHQPDQRSGALFDPTRNRWTSIPDAPFCPTFAVDQGARVYALGTTCTSDAVPRFGWYDLTQKRWHIGPRPRADTKALMSYRGSVVAVSRDGTTQLLDPHHELWTSLDPLPGADITAPTPAGADRVTDFVTASDGTTVYAIGQVDFGRNGTAVYAMSGNGWVETGRLPLDGHPRVQPPARFGAEAAVQDGVVVWHADKGVSWFDPATFAGGFVATDGGGPVNAIVATPLVPVGDGRFLWWGGHTGERDPATRRPLSAGALLTLR